jgi:hypothetical protein
MDGWISKDFVLIWRVLNEHDAVIINQTIKQSIRSIGQTIYEHQCQCQCQC